MEESGPTEPVIEDIEYERVDYERQFALIAPLGLCPGGLVGSYVKKNKNEQNTEYIEGTSGPDAETQKKTKKPLPIKPEHKMSLLTKNLWILAGVTGAWALALAAKDYVTPNYRLPTPAERAQLDNELRPAALDAARIAMRVTRARKLFIYEEPPKGTPRKPRAITLIATGREGLQLDVTMQKDRHGQPNYRTVYDVNLIDKAEDTLSISSINLAMGGLTSDLSYAQPFYGEAVDFNVEAPSSDIKTQLIEGKNIASQLEKDLEYFKNPKS